jgi:type VII secretion integral membrane protein EccD
MTAVPTSPNVSGAVAAPELCRITVLTKHSEVDLTLPLGVPVALLLAGIVDLVAAHRPDNEFDVTPERVEPEAWTLARIGQGPLAGALSLDELGVRDGDVLILEESSAPSAPPLFDDVMYNVAVAGRDRLRRWSDRTAAMVGAAVAAASITIGCGSLLLLPSSGSERLVAGIATAVLTLLLVTAAAVIARVYLDRPIGLLLAVCAIPVSSVTGMLLVPGDFGAPHLMLATVLTGATGVVTVSVTTVGLATFTAIPTIAAVATLALIVATTTSVPVPALGAGVVATALLLVTFAARAATLLARLPLPPVPAPGTSLDPVVPDPDDENPPPTFEELEAKTARARAHLTGWVYAVVVLATVGAWCAAWPMPAAGISWPGVGLAVATGIVLMFRGRTYIGAEQAAPMIMGGAVLVLGLIVGAALSGTVAPQALFGVTVVLFVGALIFGVVAPRRTFTPVQRRISELAEYTVIATIVPLACWVAGLYSAVRGL